MSKEIKHIDFNRPPFTGYEEAYLSESIKSLKLSGDGAFSRKCQDWFETELGCNKALLTPSCTAALEMAAILIDIKPGDEVIMPSYTFVSTANAFVLRGAKIVFVDIRPDTMNIDERLIESAITERTKAIVPVHYAGIACEMDKIMDIAIKYHLSVVEDAAQGMLSKYKGKFLGTIGNLAAISFHETKNYTSGGEGGLLIVNDDKFSKRAEIIREKGTNRSQFFRGMVDKYSWVDIGSSFLLSDLQAAYLFAQLEHAEEINQNRLCSWNFYYNNLLELRNKGLLELPTVPSCCSHNGHMFYVKVKNLDERSDIIRFLKLNGIESVFHYVPLHSSQAGKTWGRFHSLDAFTTRESERLVRLPLWYGISNEELQLVVTIIKTYFDSL